MKSWYRSKAGDASEKQALRGSAPKWTVPCVIHSRKALTFSTRLAFTVTIFTGFGVIFASIWFMLDCRQNFNSIQGLIPRHSSFCTNLGMQALFACCVLLFTIFGLGCIGRRMTGHAILIISGVAIFQGAMTLIFYQCRAMADDDIMNAVNNTLTSCRVGAGPPFSTVEFGSKHVTADEERSAIEKRKTILNPCQGHLFDTKDCNDKQYNQADLSDIDDESLNTGKVSKGIENAFESNDSLEDIIQLNQELKRKLKFSIKGTAKEKTHNTAQLKSIPTPTVKCHESSTYFVALSKNHDEKEVKTCKKICETYLDFCLGKEINADGVGAMIENQANAKGENSDNPGASTEFNKEVLVCGDKITKFVRHFCIYDSRIFTPLSLGTPIFYIFMSLCFIYLAHCDRQCKDDDNLDSAQNLRSRYRSRSSSRCSSRRSRSHSKVKDTRRPTGYSSSSPTLEQQLHGEGGGGDGVSSPTVPSPALSDVSTPWGTEIGLGRGELLHGGDSPQRRLHHLPSTSARTIETFLGDD